MPKLFLLRHAEAQLFFPDHQRPLTEKGQRDSHKLGKWMAKRDNFDIEVIWHSPLLRARQTNDCILEHWAGPPPEIRELAHITPDDNPEQLIDALESEKRNLLIVGHNPYLSFLTARLLTGNSDGLWIHFKKTGLLALERQGNQYALCGYIGPSWL